MTRSLQGAIVAAAILGWSGAAAAWLRSHYEDAAVAARSEVIVVGHLDGDSIQYVPHQNTGDRGRSWEYHATLVVTETLKGATKEKRIPIVINYGLEPQAAGRDFRNTPKIEAGAAATTCTEARIDIADHGSMGGTVLTHAEQDNLWFLRHLGGELGREVGKGPLGILDPQDVAILKFKGYFQALLAEDADARLDGLLADSDEDIVARVLRHLAAQRRPSDAPRIAKLLACPQWKIPPMAAAALAEVGDLSAVPTFRKVLAHENPQVRVTAAGFLCRFHDTESIPAIGPAMKGLDGWQRAGVLGSLPGMESRPAVELLLDQLDEHVEITEPHPRGPYAASTAAAGALRALTGAEFPLDTIQARRRWAALKDSPDELLLRKRMQEEIEALTDPVNYHARWEAYETLGKLANQHFGSYDAFHGPEDAAGREKSQALWRAWARENITRPRVDWIYAGFAQSGIDLPRPMDAKGVDTLIAVLDFYGDWGNRKKATSRPVWSIDGGWVKGNFHRANADWLLERLTGHRVGGQYQRWAAWWKENRDKVKLLPLPEEKPVTAEMLAKVPPLRLPPPPLTLTIRPKHEVHIFKGPEPLTIVVEIKNTSSQDVVLEQRPAEVKYTGSTVSGSRGIDGHGGTRKDEYITLEPGQTLRWEQPDAPGVDNLVKPASVERLQYELPFWFAGSQFGLRAWRGVLLSNLVTCKVEAKE